MTTSNVFDDRLSKLLKLGCCEENALKIKVSFNCIFIHVGRRGLLRHFKNHYKSKEKEWVSLQIQLTFKKRFVMFRAQQ